MASTFDNNLRLREMGTGDESGTWGARTNENLELIGEAFGYGTEAITTNANTHTTTIDNGATDPGRAMYLKYTGALDSACTVTLGPDTVSKLWFIENATSGSQNLIIKQIHETSKKTKKEVKKITNKIEDFNSEIKSKDFFVSVKNLYLLDKKQKKDFFLFHR